MGRLNLISLLFEDKIHLDNEIVDFNQINLQKEFDKLNTILFNDFLEPVTLGFDKSKNAHGVVKATRNKLTGKIDIKSLTISKFYNIPYKVFKDTLAHEMIHVYLLQQGINAGHGYQFIKEMNRINSMGLGFNVTVTNSTAFEVSPENVKSNYKLVFSITRPRPDKMQLSVMTYDTYKKEAKKIGNLYSNLIKAGKFMDVAGEFYLSTSPALQSHTIQRKFERSLSFAMIDKNQYEQLIAGAKPLSKFNCTKLSCEWSGDDIPNEPEPEKPKLKTRRFLGYY